MQGLYDPSANPAIGKLVEFAAQNPGLEFGNYGQWDAYNQERASITRDWKRFLKALRAASDAGVTDADVITEGTRAFSGRLEWKTSSTVWEGQTPNCTKREEPAEGHWEYTTGQYFPTEYRKAAATVLEYATRAHLQAQPPTKKATIRTIAELQELNIANGGCWFSKDTIRFFRTRIESGILYGHYFISSEQREDDTPRKFTVRSFDDEGGIDTIGEFHSHNSKADAIEALREHLANPVTA